jgi:predicted nucleotidyltransferase
VGTNAPWRGVPATRRRHPVAFALAGTDAFHAAFGYIPLLLDEASSYGSPARNTKATMNKASADGIIATLRVHQLELRRAGVRRLSLFGSAARGEATATSDIDLAAELDPASHIGLFRLTAIERRLAQIVGRDVDLFPEPVEQPRLQSNIDRDRRRAF